jgi:hypothetical protein
MKPIKSKSKIIVLLSDLHIKAYHPIRNRVKRMHEKGELTCRKLLIKGRYVNVYKKVEG